MKHLGSVMLVIAVGAFFTASAKGEGQKELDDLVPLEVFRDCSLCPEMVLLPLGDFLMGGPVGESKNRVVPDPETMLRALQPEETYEAEHEGPVHPVRIDIPIAMGRTEVTSEQYMMCVADGGCPYEPPQKVLRHTRMYQSEGAPAWYPVTGSQPVVEVNYHDAQDYIAWLNTKIGMDAYRLPTEAEWEYAARSGTQTPFPFGDTLAPEQAAFSRWGTERMEQSSRPDLPEHYAPVPVEDLDAANAWGLRHMSGNVLEWTRSCWTSRYAGWSASSEWLVGSFAIDNCEGVSLSGKGVTRGGSYAMGMDQARSGARSPSTRTHRSREIGFRVLREIGDRQ